jgi:hypothetical protein
MTPRNNGPAVPDHLITNDAVDVREMVFFNQRRANIGRRKPGGESINSLALSSRIPRKSRAGRGKISTG